MLDWAGLASAGVGALTNLISGKKQNAANEQAQQRQYEQQKEFAQSGIQWKVADAKAAGIHPLYALGANTVSYSPQSVGGPDFSHISAMGQNIGRAIDATRSNPAKEQALQTTLLGIQLEGAQLDNDLKRATLSSALATARQAGNPPGLPSTSTIPDMVSGGMPGQGNSPQVEGPDIRLEKKISPTAPGQPHAEYGASPEVSWFRTADGGYAPMIPQALSESLEQDLTGRYQWQARNKIAPVFSEAHRKPPAGIHLPKGHYWDYNPFLGAWYQYPKGKRAKWRTGQ